MQTDEIRQAMSTLQAFSEKERAYHAYQARQNYLREQRSLQRYLKTLQAQTETLQAQAERERAAKEQERAAKEAERVSREVLRGCLKTPLSFWERGSWTVSEPAGAPVPGRAGAGPGWWQRFWRRSDEM
jgi:hypothetical protein